MRPWTKVVHQSKRQPSHRDSPPGVTLVGFLGVRDPNMKHYVVCCEPRVVLSGWATPEEIKKRHPTLADVRMCVYWDKETQGPMGLASTGPSSSCRITHAAPSWTIATKKEGYGECSPAATTAWESEPWG